MHTLITDAEAVFLGFSNVCASAGKDGCKLVTLLHSDPTGEEVKRLIEDSHDVGNRLGSGRATPLPRYDSQLALKVFLTNPAKSVVDPRQMKRGSAFVTLRIILGFTRTTVLIFITLYAPGIWGRIANQVLYPLIHNIHRSARTANVTTIVTVANLLDEDVQVNKELLHKILRQPPLSHSTTAIYAADSWESDNSTTADVYGMIVKTSREVSPMCASISSSSRLTAV